MTQYALGKELREISGLAFTDTRRLLAVADEYGVVYELDLENGEFSERYAFGNPPVAGDFEGVAYLDGHLHVVTSDGELFTRALGAGNDPDFTQVDTGIGKRCEVEGLEAWPSQQLLLMLCKTARKKSLRDKLTIFAWSLTDGTIASAFNVEVDLDETGFKKLNPSGLAWSKPGTELIIVAAKQKRFVTITPGGRVLRSGQLPNPQAHRQVEGIAIDIDGTLYLADEGDKRGTLSRYEAAF